MDRAGKTMSDTAC